MSRRFSSWLVGFAAVLVVAGVGASPASGEEELRGRVAELERHKRVSEVEIARLRQEIARLERELEAAREDAEMARREAEEARVSPEVVAQDLIAASTVEESDVPDEELELVEPAPTVEIRPPASAPPAAPTSAPPPAAPPAAPPSAPATASDPVTAEARALYDASYTLFHERRYDEAAASFARFLELHARTSLSDNAQFWIGECHYARGEYASALAAFMATVERYPSGNKIPDALVKAGKSLEGLDDREGAVETYREIRSRFPGTAAAAVASERLAALDAAG